MKQVLIHKKTGVRFVIFESGKPPKFASKFTQIEMDEDGINIPPNLMAEYGNADVVYPEDPAFPKAFKDFYYTEEMDAEQYVWVQREPSK